MSLVAAMLVAVLCQMELWHSSNDIDDDDCKGQVSLAPFCSVVYFGFWHDTACFVSRRADLSVCGKLLVFATQHFLFFASFFLFTAWHSFFLQHGALCFVSRCIMPFFLFSFCAADLCFLHCIALLCLFAVLCSFCFCNTALLFFHCIRPLFLFAV